MWDVLCWVGRGWEEYWVKCMPRLVLWVWRNEKFAAAAAKKIYKSQ
jgi:hypothetical protein